MAVYLFVHGCLGRRQHWSGIYQVTAACRDRNVICIAAGLGEKVHQVHPAYLCPIHISD